MSFGQDFLKTIWAFFIEVRNKTAFEFVQYSHTATLPSGLYLVIYQWFDKVFRIDGELSGMDYEPSCVVK